MSEAGDFSPAVSYRDDDEDVQENEDDRVPGHARAAVRFLTGTVPWRENMYQTQVLRRQRKEGYRDYMKQYWMDNSGNMLKKRKEQRAKAKQAMDGLIKKVGRPPVPKEAMMVEKELAAPLNIEQMVFLGKPDVFGNIQDRIEVPEDLVNYLRLPALYIDDRPLHWPMFRFSAWGELEPSTRKSYVGSARLALGKSGYTDTKEQQLAADQFFYYSAQDDKAYVEEQEEELDAEVQGAININEAGAADKQVKKKKAAGGGRKPFTQNPLRIIKFMLDVDADPWTVVRRTFETTQANNYASGLASCTYAYLRYLYEKGDYKSPLFRRLLTWSFIYSRYTSVARKDTGDRHASQLTTPEKMANTVEWETWKAAVMERLRHYFIIHGDQVAIKEKVNPRLPMPYGARPKFQILDDGKKNEYVPNESTLPPWKRSTYDDTPRRPNLRELRDCAILASYSLLAPIRLDWATVEVMDDKDFASFKTARENSMMPEQAADEEKDKEKAIAVKDRKRAQLDKNVIVVDNKLKPLQLSKAYFAKMKNKAKFKVLPVLKNVRGESALCANILLAYLQERSRLGYKSKCLFPANTTPRNEELAPTECFTNSAFGGLLADMAWDLTGKNFTETLMRRSFITWFWEQPGNDPLNQATWDYLLPMVHQTSSSTNIGYIKQRSIELETWMTAHPKASPQERLAEVKRIRQAALHDTGQDTNPEMDELAVQEQQADVEAVEITKKQVQEVKLRRSARLQPEPEEPPAAPIKQPKPAIVIPQAPPIIKQKVVKKAAAPPKKVKPLTAKAKIPERTVEPVKSVSRSGRVRKPKNQDD